MWEDLNCRQEQSIWLCVAHLVEFLTIVLFSETSGIGSLVGRCFYGHVHVGSSTD